MENNLTELTKLPSTVITIDYIDEQEFLSNIDKFKPTAECYIIHPTRFIPLKCLVFEFCNISSIYYHAESKFLLKYPQYRYSNLKECIDNCEIRIRQHRLKLMSDLDNLNKSIRYLDESVNTINKIENEL